MVLKRPKQAKEIGPAKSKELLLLQAMPAAIASKYQEALKRIITIARYTGSPYHRSPGSRAGNVVKRAGLSSRCPPTWTNAAATEVLRKAISEVRVSQFWEGGFPRYVWHLDGDVLYEARLTNQGNGEYHGYPLEDKWEWPKQLQ